MSNQSNLLTFDECVQVATKIKGLKKSEYKVTGKYPVIDQGQNFVTAYSDRQDLVESNTPFIVFGDHTRIIKYIDSPVILGNDGVKILRPKESLNARYLYYNLLCIRIPNTGYNRHFKFLIENKLMVPSLATQQKIAEILSSVDEAIQKTDQIIKKTEVLKYGLMENLLVKGIGHKKFKKTKFGEIPEEWELVTLGDVAKITNGQVDPKKEPYNNMTLIAPNHIESSSGRILERVSAFAQQAISGKYLVKSGDVIYSKIRPYLKKVTIADSDCLCSADMYPIKGTEKLDSRFLFHILLSDNFTNYANDNSGRTGIPKINRDELNGYIFTLPPVAEQQQIASILSSIDNDILSNQKAKAIYVYLKNGLMHDIFSQKIQVN